MRLRARAIVKKELALDVALYTFYRILSVHSFEEKSPFAGFLSDEPNPVPTNIG